MKSTFNIEFRYLHPEHDELPPKRDEPWVAIVEAPISPGKTHALTMRNGTIRFDPAGYRTGGTPDLSEVRAALAIVGSHGEVVAA